MKTALFSLLVVLGLATQAQAGPRHRPTVKKKTVITRTATTRKGRKVVVTRTKTVKRGKATRTVETRTIRRVRRVPAPRIYRPVVYRPVRVVLPDGRVVLKPRPAIAPRVVRG